MIIKRQQCVSLISLLLLDPLFLAYNDRDQCEVAVILTSIRKYPSSQNNRTYGSFSHLIHFNDNMYGIILL